MALRRSFAGVGSASVGLAGAAFYYRPDPNEGELLDKQTTISRKFKSAKTQPASALSTTDRAGSQNQHATGLRYVTGSENLADDATEPEPILLRGARAAVVTSVAAISQMVMFGLNNTKVVTDERHAKLVSLVKDRANGQPLLTVANHTSTLDDPALVSAMMPWSVLLKPSIMRWSICSQEICFETAGIAAFFGAGKASTVLPIERGAGLDQKLLLDFSRKLAAGAWCHVFPEGKTVQTGTIGGRSPPESDVVGRLKWGIGKSIAHAPRTPRIVPFYHTGMQNLVAEDPASKDVLPTQPRFFNDITLRVGNEINVSDLIARHEEEHGRLWKYSASTALGGAEDERKWALSSPQERKLYSAIVLRIEAALYALEDEAKAELGDAYPTIPKLVASGEYRALLAKK